MEDLNNVEEVSVDDLVEGEDERPTLPPPAGYDALCADDERPTLPPPAGVESEKYECLIQSLRGGEPKPPIQNEWGGLVAEVRAEIEAYWAEESEGKAPRTLRSRAA